MTTIARCVAMTGILLTWGGLVVASAAAACIDFNSDARAWNDAVGHVATRGYQSVFFGAAFVLLSVIIAILFANVEDKSRVVRLRCISLFPAVFLIYAQIIATYF
ncbi:MAG: hypothetical protein JWN70_2221 [Planctomycetaceae bacterium]|nr:hypothetical protein [Planctomycetaceae bacterium]